MDHIKLKIIHICRGRKNQVIFKSHQHDCPNILQVWIVDWREQSVLKSVCSERKLQNCIPYNFLVRVSERQHAGHNLSTCSKHIKN